MLPEIQQGIVDALEDVVDAVGENLVAVPYSVRNPAAPTIDVYPADPFSDSLGFGPDVRLEWTLRARINTIDDEGAQHVLLSLMEPAGETSVREALLYGDYTLNGIIGALDLIGPSGFIEFFDVGTQSRHLGVTWRVSTITVLT